MKNTIILSMLLLPIGFSSVLAQSAGKGNLTFYANNFRDEQGKAIVLLFKKGDAIPANPSLKASGAIVDGKSVMVFEDIPYGEYAAILFQDENSNGILDHSWGLPKEPKGFSNGWKLNLFSGMPNFSKLKFSFSQQTPACTVTIQ